MSFRLLDVVYLLADLPSEGLFAGMRGTIVDIYNNPYKAYEVEFCDDRGQTIVSLALKKDLLEKVIFPKRNS